MENLQITRTLCTSFEIVGKHFLHSFSYIINLIGMIFIHTYLYIEEARNVCHNMTHLKHDRVKRENYKTQITTCR